MSSMLNGKNVLLGVSGSIAAYKAAFLVRALIKAGAHVQVVMTEAARAFITPLTLATLSKRPVLHALVRDYNSGEWENHVALGLWADVMIVAPATAHTLAAMAHGDAGNLLLTTYLSAKCPVFFAPAMDADMHSHSANHDNISLLEKRGNIQIPAAEGELASGLEGFGRLAEPVDILNSVVAYLEKNAPFRGKKVLITAGPTHEAIDPVRYIGNNSSGKMGFALAQEATKLGAKVTLVSGPTQVQAPNVEKLIDVVSAAQMFDAAMKSFPEMDIAICAAAVADFKPIEVLQDKMKKKNTPPDYVLKLEPTVDILASLGKSKQAHQRLIGFALETDEGLNSARLKMHEKNCDFIVLNSLKHEGAGFGYDTNKISIVNHNKSITLELKSKTEVAKDIMNYIIELDR